MRCQECTVNWIESGSHCEDCHLLGHEPMSVEKLAAQIEEDDYSRRRYRDRDAESQEEAKRMRRARH